MNQPLRPKLLPVKQIADKIADTVSESRIPDPAGQILISNCESLGVT